MSGYVMGEDGNAYVMGQDGAWHCVGAMAPIRIGPQSAGARPGSVVMPQPQGGALLHLPPKPPWRQGEVAPGVWGPAQRKQIMPLTPGHLDEDVNYATMEARPQLPFQGIRLVCSVQRSTGVTAIVLGQLFVGTLPQMVELGEFDVENFTKDAFDMDLEMTPAQPGTLVRLVVRTVSGLGTGEEIFVTAQINGKSLQLGARRPCAKKSS